MASFPCRLLASSFHMLIPCDQTLFLDNNQQRSVNRSIERSQPLKICLSLTYVCIRSSPALSVVAAAYSDFTGHQPKTGCGQHMRHLLQCCHAMHVHVLRHPHILSVVVALEIFSCALTNVLLRTSWVMIVWIPNKQSLQPKTVTESLFVRTSQQSLTAQTCHFLQL